ncbi:hypothetical protein IWZ01DRAFT_480484 [Phyllosticta capitalensis]
MVRGPAVLASLPTFLGRTCLAGASSPAQRTSVGARKQCRQPTTLRHTHNLKKTLPYLDCSNPNHPLSSWYRPLSTMVFWDILHQDFWKRVIVMLKKAEYEGFPPTSRRFMLDWVEEQLEMIARVPPGPRRPNGTKNEKKPDTNTRSTLTRFRPLHPSGKIATTAPAASPGI